MYILSLMLSACTVKSDLSGRKLKIDYQAVEGISAKVNGAFEYFKSAFSSSNLVQLFLICLSLSVVCTGLAF